MRQAGLVFGRRLYVALGATLLLLGLLAGLQYRWAGELSEADRVRLRTSARVRAEALARDLDAELSQLYVQMGLDSESVSARSFETWGQRYDSWRRSALVPELVDEIYLIEPGVAAPRPSRYAPERRTFEPADWPPALTQLRDDWLRERREPLPQRPGSRFTLRRGFGPLSDDPPALLIPLFPRQPWPEPRRAGPLAPPSLLVVTLDLNAITQDLLPALAERHFGNRDGLDHDLWVVRRGEGDQRLWASNPLAVHAAAPEVDVPLFELRLEGLQPPPGGPTVRFGGPFGHAPGRWLLKVAHRAGSFDEVVATTRRRNLAVSFGVLLLLLASVSLVIVSAQRARALAERQMRFVASVSHELRTPVAVVCSTAENLADGIVNDPAQVRVYGAVLRDEGRRLRDMTERVLEFAGASAHARAPELLETVSIGALVEEVLAVFAETITQRGFQVEKTIAPNLPALQGDPEALRRALQNLVENALKYDSGGRWLGIKVEFDGRQVCVAVEDRGQGIAETDLPHVFEPFFRGGAARTARVRGFGLGLALVRRTAQNHGGSVSVSSTPGHGSAFLLRLPASSSQGLS